MPISPPAHDKIARRWLAKRRCIRALRRTLTFIVLVTPFLFFGYVLCCHMPVTWRYAIPNWILLFECWMFFYNLYIFLRYVWAAPILAILPILITLVYIIFYPFCPYAKINRMLYFNLFREDRLEVIRMIECGELLEDSKDEGRILLPGRYQHTSFQEGMVNYKRKEHETTVLFSTGWDLLTYHEGFQYIPDDTPKNWFCMENIDFMEAIEPTWVYLLY